MKFVSGCASFHREGGVRDAGLNFSTVMIRSRQNDDECRKQRLDGQKSKMLKYRFRNVFIRHRDMLLILSMIEGKGKGKGEKNPRSGSQSEI